jgi:hypothetical protein
MTSPQWIPADIKLSGTQLSASWIDIGNTSPELPCLSDRIEATVAAGGILREAPLPPLPAAAPALATGLIFHAGRCGSTLVSRKLAQVASCHVISEPAAINRVLSAGGEWPFTPPDFRKQTLQQLIHAFRLASQPEQSHLLFKLSSWNALHLDCLETILPTTPLIFLYRAPEEILVSLAEAPSAWAQRAENLIQAGLFLRASPQRVPSSPLSFMACTVGKIMTSVAESIARQPAGRWCLVNYNELPARLSQEIAQHLNLALSPKEHEILTQPSYTHAKDAGFRRPFSPDSARKQASVTAPIRALAQEFMQAPYQRLEMLRTQPPVGQCSTTSTPT